MQTHASEGRNGDALGALVQRIARGEEASLRALYDAYSPRVLGLARRILRDDAAAEDVVVEVFDQIWRQAARFDSGRGDVTTWITTMARTRAIDALRERERRERRTAAFATERADDASEPFPTPFHAADLRDRASFVQRALDRLPGEQRAALEAAYFRGLSHTEIATALGAPLGTIKTRIRSGLCALRSALEAAEGGLT